MTSIASTQPCDKAIIQSAADCPTASSSRWVLWAAILASSMVFVDGSVVNVALPRMQTNLHATAADMQWVVESYSLMLAALILVGGALGDKLGRRRIFVIGVIIFTAGSLWCGFAPNIDMLIIARALQGIGGALLTPGSLSLISANFNGEARGKAIGSWSGWTTLTSAAGPVLGGWLVQNVSWRWAFFINLPLAIAVLVITIAHIPESRDESQSLTPLDWLGSAFATFGLAGVVYGLIRLGSQSAGIGIALFSLIAGVAALGGFIQVERTGKNPMMPLDLFKSRTFSGANALTFLLYAALGGLLYFLPFDLIQVHHYTATAAGASLLPFVGVMFLLSRWAGGLVSRYGPKKPLVVGPIIAGLGLGLLAVPGTGGNYWKDFLPAILVLGFGMTITVVPLTTVVMGALSSSKSGLASGVNNAVSRIASLLAIAVFGLLLAFTFRSQLNAQIVSLHASAEVRTWIESRSSQLGGLTIPITMPDHEVLQAAVANAFVAGFRVTMLAGAALALMSAVVASLLIEDSKPNTNPSKA